MFNLWKLICTYLKVVFYLQIDIKYCDYIIDSDYPTFTELEPRYSLDANWNVTFSLPFLDAQRYLFIFLYAI